jgi:hypothetical protein
MNIRLISLCSAILSTCLKTSGALAAICIGNCGTLGADGDISAPPSGETYNYVSTSDGVSGAGQIEGIGGTNGSEYISDIFTAAAGDPLQFYFNYVTADGLDFTDYGFSELLTSTDNHIAWLFTARTDQFESPSPGVGLPANDSTLTPSVPEIIFGASHWSPLGESSGDCFGDFDAHCGNTGWVQSVYNIGAAGDYKIRFGVSNFGDEAVHSGLAFAGVAAAGNPVINPGNAVPEPASWAMMISGMGLAGAALRGRNGRIAVCHA